MKVVLPLILASLLAMTSCNLLNHKDSNKNHSNIPGKIVFSAQAGGTYQIFTINADGSSLKQLTHFPAKYSAIEPSWSPDGSKIVFAASKPRTSLGTSLYIMNADGSDRHPMNKRKNINVPTTGSDPQWSSDGSKILFYRCVSCSVSTNHVIFYYEFKTDSVVQLTDFARGVSNMYPKWSPDGSKIAFVSDRAYPEDYRFDIYLMNLEGNNVKRITKTGNIGSFAWGPNKNMITFRPYGTSTKLSKLNIETGKITAIKIKEIKRTIFQPQVWSPDGKKLLLFKYELDYPRVNALLIFNAEKENLTKIFSLKTLDNANLAIMGSDWFIPDYN